MTSKVILTKKMTLEVLESLFSTLETEESYITMKTEWYDTDEPRLDENGNPKTREDGSIIYKSTYRDVPRPEEDYTDEQRAKLEAIKDIKKQLEKLI